MLTGPSRHTENYTITKLHNYSMILACQFTGEMLPLTISVISLSINHLKD